MDIVLPFLLSRSLELICPQIKKSYKDEDISNPVVVHFILNLENRSGQYSMYFPNKNGGHNLTSTSQTNNLLITDNIVQFPANQYGVAMTISRTTMKAGQVYAGIFDENDFALYYQCRVNQRPVQEKLF